MKKIDLNTLRKLQIEKQGLNHSPNFHDIKNVNTLLQKIKFVQLDSINVCGRSQDLFFWNRFNNYKYNNYLNLYQKDSVTEVYSHALTLVYKQSSLREIIQNIYKKKMFLSKDLDEILDYYSEVIPKLPSKQSELVINKSNNWGISSEEKKIEFLWRSGILGIERDENFNKHVYLCNQIDTKSNINSNTDLVNYYYEEMILTTFENLGAVTLSEICRFYNLKKGLVEEIILKLLNTDEVTRIHVKGFGEHYMLSRDINLLETLKGMDANSLKFLSPFDNLIRDRVRTLKIFNIDYRLESYIPKQKRIHGYYALPILADNMIIGTIDLKIDRLTSTLNINNMTYFYPIEGTHYPEYIEKQLLEMINMLGIQNIGNKERLHYNA